MKKFVLLLPLLILSGCFTKSCKNEEWSLSEAKWHAIFEDYNTVYFKGRLPHNTKIVSKELDYDTFGVTIFKFGSDPAKVPIEIDINPFLVQTQNEAHMTLLHEMCHISVDLMDPKNEDNKFDSFFHGPLWQAEMTRLADEGAFRNLW